MEQLQIGDGEMLALHVRDMARVAAPQSQPTRQQANTQQRGGQGYPDPETLRLRLLGDPAARQQAANQQPELAAAVESPERFAQLVRQMQDTEREDQARRRQQIADLNADPFDIEAQTRIAEMIREERVQENLQNAIEHNPEGTPASVEFEILHADGSSLWPGTYVVH
jgi:DNA damage-inducible protein 1